MGRKFKIKENLVEKYHNEREEICKKILSILDMEDGHSFILYHLEHDIEKQNKILELTNEIKKYFDCSKMQVFRGKLTSHRTYVNIIRRILRLQGYTFTSHNTLLYFPNGMHINTMKYIIER